MLYYWLTAATYLVTGPGEGAARLWSALSGAGLVLLVWAAARRRDRRRARDAWLAGAIVATCFGYFTMARSALPDLPLAFCITLGDRRGACGARCRRRAGAPSAGGLLAGVGAGLGFLMKGPVASSCRRSSLAAGLVARAARRAPCGGRHVAAARRSWPPPSRCRGTSRWWREHGMAYIESFFIGDNLERFATDRFNDPRPLWFYLPVIAGGLLPWSAFGDRRRRRAAHRRWRAGSGARRATNRRLLALGASPPTLFFTASVGQQPRYILPVLPPLAILLAARHRAAHRRGATGPAAGGLRRRDVGHRRAVRALLAALLLRLQPLLDRDGVAVLRRRPSAWRPAARALGASWRCAARAGAAGGR